MANEYFRFKQFQVDQGRCAMKVTTDGCLFGAWVADKISQLENANRMLDIGTGTGLLSLMVVQENQNATIDAVEINDEAFSQASENFSSSPWNDRITAIHADAIGFKSSERYDIIFSNPPFYENELKSPDPARSLAHHDGMGFKELLTTIDMNLSLSGKFFILSPFRRVAEMESGIAKTGFAILEKTVVRHSPNHDPFRIMIMGERIVNPAGVNVNEIHIRDGWGLYSIEFTRLLKNYYLNL